MRSREGQNDLREGRSGGLGSIERTGKGKREESDVDVVEAFRSEDQIAGMRRGRRLTCLSCHTLLSLPHALTLSRAFVPALRPVDSGREEGPCPRVWSGGSATRPCLCGPGHAGEGGEESGKDNGRVQMIGREAWKEELPATTALLLALLGTVAIETLIEESK